MQIELRDYQQECVQRVIGAYEHDKHGTELLVLPTGGGKTLVFSRIIQLLNERHGLNALIIAHRDELLTQAADKYRMFQPSAIIGKIGSGVHEYGAQVTVASIATISRPEHLRRLKAIGYGLIVTDEAHHSQAEGYQKVYDALPDAFHLMVTATPDRMDGKPLLKDKEPLFEASIIDMIQRGYLCDLKAIAIKTHVNLDNLHTQAGDYKVDELEAAIDTPARNRRVVDAYKEHCNGRRAICFGVTVNHATNLSAAFNEAGIAAGIVSGETPLDERKRLYKGLHDGSIKVLSNVQVLTEGFDEPLVDCIIMARPTQSRALYVQCLDSETQILTPDGWKSHYEIQEGDAVAGYDKETGTIKWIPTLSKVERPLASDEKMFALQSPALDIRVTGGHRMVFRARNRTDINSYSKSNGATPWRFVEAETLAERGTEYELPIAGNQQVSGVPLTDDELRFIGWVLTDGTINRKNGQITIYQAAHQPYHDAIKSCLEGCGFKYTMKEETPVSRYNVTSNRIRYMISKGKPRGTDKHLSGWEKLEPFINKNLSPLLDNITAEQLEVLLEAIHMGDGHKQRGQTWTQRSYHIITGNKIFADRMQSLCVRRGFKCNISIVKREHHPAYTLHIKKISVQHVGGKHSVDKSQLIECPSTPGELVWCVENELSTLVTRRNGKVAIVGNCVGRGLRLAPAKSDCVILDLTDNCLKHRLEPQNLSKVLGKRIKDDETLLETIEREKKEASEREVRVRKLKETRKEDIQVQITARMNWQEGTNGKFVLEVGPQKHRIALIPVAGSGLFDENPGLYTVAAKLFPGYETQIWLENAPLDWAQQLAEKKARLLLADPKNIRIVDQAAPWRMQPATEVQLEKLAKWKDRFKLQYDEATVTKGEASDMLDMVYGKFEEWREKRKAAV